MCGFIGRVNFNGNISEIPHCWLEKNLIGFRGPDENYTFRDDNSIVRFYRLAMVNKNKKLSQLKFSQGISYALINGTIQNYKSISGNCDTDCESIGYGFHNEGYEIFSKLIGAFAICLKTKEKTIFAVDPVGEKNIYWAVQKGELWFSSSSLLLAYHLKKAPKSIDGLLYHLTLRGQPLGMTYFEEIYSVLPGTILTFQNNKQGVPIELQYHIKHNSNIDNEKDFTKTLNEKMQNAKFGISVSGGIDSSILAYVASVCHPSQKIKCFSLTDNQDSQFETDIYHIRLLAKSIPQIELTEVPFRTNYCFDTPRDNPILDQDEFGLHSIVETISSHNLNSIICGDGADELFCGYDRIYQFHRKEENMMADFDKFSQNFINRYSYTSLPFLSKNLESNQYKLLFDNLINYFNSITKNENTSKFKIIHNWFIKHHLFWLLRKLDFIGGQFGLESRAPYLHQNIVKFATELKEEDLIPYAYIKGKEDLLYHRDVKKVFKDYYIRKIPNEIIFRKKLPFPVNEEKIEPYYLKYLNDITYHHFFPQELHMNILSGKGGAMTKLLYLSYLIWYHSCKRDLT